MAGARDTWARIYFSRKTPRLKIHETSISQNLVYEMNLIKSKFPELDFELYESTDEKAHGDDLVLSVVHDDDNVYTYAIQSKIIYHKRKKGIADLRDGHYQQLKHWVGKGTNKKKQVDLLLEYARVNEYIPLYLFYNYVGHKFDQINSSTYGCTVISAHYLKDNYSSPDGNLSDKVKFSDLFLKAFPWHELVCTFPTLSRKGVEERLLIDVKKDNPTIRTKDQMPSLDKWQNLDNTLPAVFPEEKASDVTEIREVYVPDYDLQNINSGIQKYDVEDDAIRVFNPKFQIFVGSSKKF